MFHSILTKRFFFLRKKNEKKTKKKSSKANYNTNVTQRHVIFTKVMPELNR